MQKKDYKNFNLLKKIAYEIKKKRFYDMKNFFKKDDKVENATD